MAEEAKEAKQPQEAKQEEPKETKVEPKKEEAKKEPPKESKETPKETPKEIPKEPVKEKKEPKKQLIIEKPTNCMKCNKHLQRKSWYYRNNGYYCSKRCWKLAKKEADAKKEEKKA